MAARLHEHQRPVVIERVELPPAGREEVLVELEYGGVNPIDRYGALGRVAPDGPLPRTLGSEAAGHLEGRAVMVSGHGLGSARDGVWAEAAVVPRAAVLELPAGVDTHPAAAMGIAGLTAWKTVHDLASVAADDRVLVLGASGGVGSMIVSLAAAAGATVWGQTGSEAKVELIERQGAERALVGDAEALGPAFGEFEPTVVFDPLGADFVRPCIEALTPRGRLVSFGTSAGPEVAFNMQSLYRKMLTLYGYGGMQLDGAERRAGLDAALTALREGELKVVIDDVLALEDVNEAFERLEHRRVQGNLLLALTAS
jgi:NADPH2:quinone reductase